MAEEKLCFVIAPIGQPDSKEREKSDEVLEFIIKPAVKTRGYTAIRADEITDPGIITVDMIKYITECPLVIANLTDHNPNVFYELALRHTLGKPVIQLIEKGQLIPFDVNQSRIIEYIPNLAGAEIAKNMIISQIDSWENVAEDYFNPITTAIGIQSLSSQSNLFQDLGAIIIERLDQIQLQVQTMASTNINPTNRYSVYSSNVNDIVNTISSLSLSEAKQLKEKMEQVLGIDLSDDLS